MSEDVSLKLLKLLETNPNLSQRELASALGVSLGKANYCLKALLDKGWIKVHNFRNNPNKLAYAYLLTPNGIEAKTTMTVQFLARKMREYEALKKEIEELSVDVAAQTKQP
jgi:MarR family transcriptional regulator, temperature-dependent positive regulator of motility